MKFIHVWIECVDVIQIKSVALQIVQTLGMHQYAEIESGGKIVCQNKKTMGDLSRHQFQTVFIFVIIICTCGRCPIKADIQRLYLITRDIDLGIVQAVDFTVLGIDIHGSPQGAIVIIDIIAVEADFVGVVEKVDGSRFADVLEADGHGSAIFSSKETMKYEG